MTFQRYDLPRVFISGAPYESFSTKFRHAEQIFFNLHFDRQITEAVDPIKVGKWIDEFVSDALALQFWGICQIHVCLTDANYPPEAGTLPIEGLGHDQVDFTDNPAVRILYNKGKAVYVGVTEEKVEQG